MPTARANVSVGVANNVLYVVGGFKTDSGTTRALGTVEAYDPATNTWTTKAPMPTARGGTAAGVVNNVLYVVGGRSEAPPSYLDTVEAYDPATNTWTPKPSMPTRRANLAAAVVNNVLYAIGGDTGGAPLATVEAYKP
jgi:N-acetylneuraminic acid mutarotase